METDDFEEPGEVLYIPAGLADELRSVAYGKLHSPLRAQLDNPIMATGADYRVDGPRGFRLNLKSSRKEFCILLTFALRSLDPSEDSEWVILAELLIRKLKGDSE